MCSSLIPCAGNLHVVVEHMRSDSTADCKCGHALIKLNCGLWVHEANWDSLCPPYECECGERHNVEHPTSIRPEHLLDLIHQHKLSHPCSE